jgi:hypothetical protein
MTTLGNLLDTIRRRLGDNGAVWTNDAIIEEIQVGQSLIDDLPIYYDWTYPENLPRGFSYTQPWERAYVLDMGGFDYGCANFTYEEERRLLGDERDRIGPANHTSPFEATDQWLSSVGASTDISATVDLPTSVIALDRLTWDNQTIDALNGRELAAMDGRYELTRGEVYGYTWRKDGVRTLRKVRVPAAQASTVTVNGSWGDLRRPTDLTTDTVTGTWGIARRIPGMHPMGPEAFGLPRRPYLEGKNVRVEHFRHSRDLSERNDEVELPDRYAIYLRDYAMARLLEVAGPGQDLVLSAHYQQRWDRAMARIASRLSRMDKERVTVLGGDGRGLQRRPPRPQLPWQYGSRVR